MLSVGSLAGRMSKSSQLHFKAINLNIASGGGRLRILCIGHVFLLSPSAAAAAAAVAFLCALATAEVTLRAGLRAASDLPALCLPRFRSSPSFHTSHIDTRLPPPACFPRQSAALSCIAPGSLPPPPPRPPAPLPSSTTSFLYESTL